MNHRLAYFALLLLLFKYSSTEEPRIKRCVSGYELSFFYSPKNYKDAKQACKSYGNSRLVKVDNADITTVMDSVIKIQEESFFIDGHADSKRRFTWSDGSEVNLRDGNGYQNWADNQPNDVGGNEDCIILGRGTKQWKDSPCHETAHYICQKDKDPCITVNSTTPYVHRCIVTGSIEPHVEWRSDGNVVSNTSDQTIYQTKQQGISTLYYENATIENVGEYLCAAWNDIGTEKVSASEQVEVNGTPSIINIKSFKCNSSLLVTWKPSRSALEFPHRILVALSNEIVANLSSTPNVETEYFTEISKLQSTTEYNVQITACSKKSNCPVDYAVNMTAITSGMIKSVTNASMEQLEGNNTCIVSWEWPYIIPEGNVTQFKIIVRSGPTATSNKEDIRFVNITAEKFSYSFEPRPSKTYNVEIQSKKSVESCKTVRAIGSCIGKVFTDAIIQPSDISIILPVVGGVVILLIVVVLLVRQRRNNAFNEPAVIMDNTVNENPSNLTASTDNFGTPNFENHAQPNDINDYAAIERVEERIERTNELYAMASEVESTSSAPMYAAVNKERIPKPTSIQNQYIPEDNTYDSLHSQQQNIGSSGTYASLSKPTDSAQPVYAQVNKK